MTAARPTRDQRPYNVAYYRVHRQEEINRVMQRQRATLDLLRDLRRVPCDDCRQSFAPYVMDFDHRDPTTKLFSVAAGKSLLKNRDVLFAEVAKCDVVCANCHRMRTYAAFMDGTLRPPGFRRHIDLARTAYLQRRREAWHRRREEQVNYLDKLREQPCADCGRRYSPCVMEFDHRDPSTKRYLVSRMPGRVKVATLLEEIAKWDLVCANCHRERTFRRREAPVVPRLDGSSVRDIAVSAQHPIQQRLIEEPAPLYAA